MKDTNNGFASNQLKIEESKGFAEVEAAIKEIDRLQNLEEEEDNFEEKPHEEEHEESPEIEDTSDDEEQEEEEIKSESPRKPEKAWKEKKRRFKAQAETRAVLEEKRQILAENAQLKEMLRQAEAAGTYQYGKNAQSELEKAKILHKQAVANGDDDALADANVAIASALYNIKELEKWSSYENAQPQKQQATPPPIQEEDEVNWQIAQQWIGTHKELQPNSRSYDKEVAEVTAGFIHELDSNMKKSGNMDAMYSDDYFEVIDDFIDDFKSKRRSETTQKNRGSVGNVGSVRNSYSDSLHSGPAKTQKISLTSYEKELARIGGISEEEWAKRKSNISKIAR